MTGSTQFWAALKPAEFEKCLLSWITALHELTDGQLVAIDGKTLRRSFDAASSKSAIHMVSAWATANHITLGQVVVGAKSNEITAIPKLLEILSLSGCTVTIDAMGCQTEIAEAIVASGADYVLAAKRNQPTLYDGIQKFFDEQLETDFAKVKVSRHMTEEHGHGREESRHYLVCAVPELPDAQRWTKLKAIGVAISDTLRDGKNQCQVRYYILSKKLSARRFAAAVRGHWGIENSLHWQLDVTFGEDQCRVRQGHADANLSLLRRTALSLLKNNQSRQCGIKNKRLCAGWGRRLPAGSPLWDIACGAIALAVLATRTAAGQLNSLLPICEICVHLRMNSRPRFQPRVSATPCPRGEFC